MSGANGGPVVKVRFNNPTEFVEELRRHPSYSPEKVVRITQRYEQSRISPYIQHVSVIGGILRHAGGVLEVVELETYCGDYWSQSGDRKALEKADELADRLTGEAKELGWEVRAGSFDTNVM